MFELAAVFFEKKKCAKLKNVSPDDQGPGGPGSDGRGGRARDDGRAAEGDCLLRQRGVGNEN